MRTQLTWFGLASGIVALVLISKLERAGIRRSSL